MDQHHVIELMHRMGLQRITPRPEWVVASCPFAPWKHSAGVDRRPSFGISVRPGSYYHCFSCHSKGPLGLLPTALIQLSGQDLPEVRSYIMAHDSVKPEDYRELEDLVTELPPLFPRKLYWSFPEVPGRVLRHVAKQWGMAEETVRDRGLRFDPSESRLLFPVRDIHGRLVGVRGRYVGAARNAPKQPYREYDKGEFRLNKGVTVPRKRKLPREGRGLKSYGVWYGMKPVDRPDKSVILVEGERDRVMMLQAHPFTYIWAAMGASISAAQIRSVAALTNRVVVYMDDDEAGRLAEARLLSSLKGFVPLCRVRDHCGCKDPAEAVQRGRLARVLKTIDK